MNNFLKYFFGQTASKILLGFILAGIVIGIRLILSGTLEGLLVVIWCLIVLGFTGLFTYINYKKLKE